MSSYIVFIAVFGLIILITAWLPLVLKRLPLSLPIACIALGAVLAISPVSYVIQANPLENRLLTERLTEFVILVSLMGAGLKLDRPLAFHRWMATWRLLALSMPLTIFAIALLGWSMLGLGLAASLLLGASLAPTDPVLASDVQVGPPNSDDDDEARFALTSEAGLNDGLSLPFVKLAVALALASQSGKPWFADWLIFDVAWGLAAGLAMGWVIGRLLGWITFRVPKPAQLARTHDGLVAIGITCLCYGLTELIHGYGFLAVFISAVSLRSVERSHNYHEELHNFTEQIERLLMMVILVCFGASIADGAIFAALDWRVAAVSVLIVLAVRPLIGALSLIGHKAPWEEKAVIAFFGIRGLGSFYYLAYAVGRADFSGVATLWVTVCLVVLLSIILHGITVTPVMNHLDRRRQRQGPAARPA